jgi:hypothetical protein
MRSALTTAVVQGIYYYPNGDSFSGVWVDDAKTGPGTYTFNKSGSQVTGDWVDGQCAEATWTMPDGTFYVGGFKVRARPACLL